MCSWHVLTSTFLSNHWDCEVEPAFRNVIHYRCLKMVIFWFNEHASNPWKELEKCTNMSAQGCWSPVLPSIEPHFGWTPLAHLQPASTFLSEWGSLEPRGHAYPVLLPLDHAPDAQDLGKALSSEVHLPGIAWATNVLCPRLKGELFAGSIHRIWTCGHRRLCLYRISCVWEGLKGNRSSPCITAFQHGTREVQGG